MKSLMSKTVKTICIVLALAAAACAAVFALLVLFLSITEYRPSLIEAAHAVRPNRRSAMSGDLPAFDTDRPLRIVSWNIGYGGLGAKQDFFMDGGTMVRPENKAAVEENLHGAAALMKRVDADILFIQEIDLKSKRSFYVDESRLLSDALSVNGAYTYNYKCLFVPVPYPPLGRVASGLATFTNIDFSESVRYALPVSFKWPVRLANLKRCLLVNRFPLTSGGELVAVNLHLEAYDEGEGKIAQTKALMTFLTDEYAKGNYVVAGGDFNQTFPGLDLSAYPAVAGVWQAAVMDASILPEGWRFAADDKAPSCRLNNGIYAEALKDENLRKNWQYYVIDGFIVSPNVEVKSVRTLNENFMYADHNPVEIEVSLRAQER
ncbi:endonuclease/exonuclease/phosphatase family protein [Treponema sp. HNW]|uniref:endonuclease/exonuclease/phosphatase family protein n=1 Tax=Treponema sp. HNW TaxID=3116654 RepID=UPI003D10D8D7